jgi:hypothetical protein
MRATDQRWLEAPGHYLITHDSADYPALLRHPQRAGRAAR